VLAVQVWCAQSLDPSLPLTLWMWLRETNVHMYTLEGNMLSRCFVITWCSCSGQSCCGTASYCVKLAAIFSRARVMPFPVSPSAGYLHTNLQPEQGQNSSPGNPPLQVSAVADEKNFKDRPVALLCTNIIHREYILISLVNLCITSNSFYIMYVYCLYLK